MNISNINIDAKHDLKNLPNVSQEKFTNQNLNASEWKNTVNQYYQAKKLQAKDLQTKNLQAREAPSNNASPATTDTNTNKRNPAKCEMHVYIYEYKNYREEKRSFLRRAHRTPFANLSTRLNVNVESASATNTFASAQIIGGKSLKPIDQNFGTTQARAYVDSTKTIPPETLTGKALKQQRKKIADRLKELHMILKYQGYCIINGDFIGADLKEVKIEKYTNNTRDIK